MNVSFLIAGGLCGAVTALHVFGGGPAIARPLLKAKDLKDAPKYTQYYCWHLVTIVLALNSAAFIYSGLRTSAQDLAWFVIILSAAFCVWGIVLPPMKKQSYAAMPQGWLFAPIALVGMYGALA